MLILQHGHRHSEFHRNPGLALHAPARVLLEDRKHLLFLRDLLAFQQAAVHLVELPPGMLEVRLDPENLGGSDALLPKRGNRRFRPSDLLPAGVEVRLDRPRTGPPGPPNLLKEPLQPPAPMPPLPPSGHPRPQG